MVTKKKPSRRADAPDAAPEYPKAMVKVTRNTGGGFDVSEQKANDAEAEASAVESGFHPVADLVTEPEIQEYPAWRYHKTQGSKIVQSEAEDDKLGPGWESTPYVKPEPEPVGIAEPDPEEDR